MMNTALKGILLSTLLSGVAGANTLGEWITKQNETSRLWLSKNISPDGAHPGTVIASPSRHYPDYYYHWVRDAGLVMSTWLDVRSSGVADSVKALIDQNMKDYWQITLHHQTRSSSWADLGDVKFHVNGDLFTGDWGRPQNDGPAIRALSLMKWRSFLVSINSPLASDPHLYSTDLSIHSAIKRDLEYMSHRWGITDFDVWEEVRGHHFFSRLFQMYALRAGTDLALEFGDAEAAKWYSLNAGYIKSSLNHFWDAGRGFITATINRDGGLDYKSGLDSAIVIAVMETDQYAKLGIDEWTVLDSRVQATVQRLESEFKKIYTINALADLNKGPMIGRYPEDTYDGVATNKRGNPWFLNTHYMAEFYYKLAAALEATGEIHINQTSRQFWSKYLSGEETRIVKGRHSQWNKMLRDLVGQGDAIMSHAKTYVGPFGNMAEQVNRDSGVQTGARDLSWSYSSFLRAAAAREKVASFLERN